jgi:hypothetical protein
MPLYQLLYEGEEPPQPPSPASQSASEASVWGSFGMDARFLRKLRQLLPRMRAEDRKLLLSLLEEMARRKKRKGP